MKYMVPYCLVCYVYFYSFIASIISKKHEIQLLEAHVKFHIDNWLASNSCYDLQQ